jgi:hypothetical protein
MLQSPFWEITVGSAGQSCLPFMKTPSPYDPKNPVHVHKPAFLKSTFLPTLMYDLCPKSPLLFSFPSNIA